MYDALIQFMKNTAVRNETAENRLGSYDQILQRNKTLSRYVELIIYIISPVGIVKKKKL